MSCFSFMFSIACFFSLFPGLCCFFCCITYRCPPPANSFTLSSMRSNQHYPFSRLQPGEPCPHYYEAIMCPAATPSWQYHKSNSQNQMKKIGLYAFLLKHNSLHLPPWHNHFFFFLYVTTITLFFTSLQYTIFNPYFSFRFFYFFYLNFQGQAGQTMPLVSVWIVNATGDHCLGFPGNALTINFQLKQTKRWQLRVYERCQESVLIYDKWA